MPVSGGARSLTVSVQFPSAPSPRCRALPKRHVLLGTPRHPPVHACTSESRLVVPEGAIKMISRSPT